MAMTKAGGGTSTKAGTGGANWKKNISPSAARTPVDYLKLNVGLTTFTLSHINGYKFVHWEKDLNGTTRKIWCSPGCGYCRNGSKRQARLSMEVIHNGDVKVLEVGARVGNEIINIFSKGDVVTIERIGTGFSTRFNVLNHYNTLLTKTTAIQFQSDDREEGIKELMYDIQRTVDYVEKYSLIKDFARKY